MARAAATPDSLGSDTLTRDIRVRARPSFMPEHSDTNAARWVFAYRITITHEGEAGAPPVQLLARRWRIVNAEGEAHEVRGEGVIGQQPILAPGETHEYSSFCPIQTPWGTMEGAYRFRTIGDAHDEEEFDVEVGRFYFVAPAKR